MPYETYAHDVEGRKGSSVCSFSPSTGTATEQKRPSLAAEIPFREDEIVFTRLDGDHCHVLSEDILDSRDRQVGYDNFYE